MKKLMTVGYQYRQGKYGDLPAASKIVIANHLLKEICEVSVGDKVEVEYLPSTIIIKKIQS